MNVASWFDEVMYMLFISQNCRRTEFYRAHGALVEYKDLGLFVLNII